MVAAGRSLQPYNEVGKTLVGIFVVITLAHRIYLLWRRLLNDLALDIVQAPALDLSVEDSSQLYLLEAVQFARCDLLPQLSIAATRISDGWRPVSAFSVTCT